MVKSSQNWVRPALAESSIDVVRHMKSKGKSIILSHKYKNVAGRNGSSFAHMNVQIFRSDFPLSIWLYPVHTDCEI